MMRIISVNVNGIRAAARKGLFDWLADQNASVICVQETKAQLQQDHETREALQLPGYTSYFADAERKGYSGVGLYCREKPIQITRGLGWPAADQEGRYIQADFPNFSVVSLYLPSGSSGEERQQVKFDFMARYQGVLDNIRKSERPFIICGDWNIVHREIDIKNFKANQKHSGCLPEERAWLDHLLSQQGWVDAFRVVNQNAEEYTWWSNRGQAWAKNVGWRIDYQIVTPDLKEKVTHVAIYKDERFSDHAPLIVDYRDIC